MFIPQVYQIDHDVVYKHPQPNIDNTTKRQKNKYLIKSSRPLVNHY